VLHDRVPDRHPGHRPRHPAGDLAHPRGEFRRRELPAPSGHRRAGRGDRGRPVRRAVRARTGSRPRGAGGCVGAHRREAGDRPAGVRPRREGRALRTRPRTLPGPTGADLPGPGARLPRAGVRGPRVHRGRRTADGRGGRRRFGRADALARPALGRRRAAGGGRARAAGRGVGARVRRRRSRRRSCRRPGVAGLLGRAPRLQLRARSRRPRGRGGPSSHPKIPTTSRNRALAGAESPTSTRSATRRAG
jgi:hypothetical protein